MSRATRIGGRQGKPDRIVALLFALADLAERAAGAPRPIRWLVLWALQEADMVAREFVASHSWDAEPRHWSPALVTIRYGSDPVDAMNLALSLRMLACAIRTLDAQARHLSLARLAGSFDECSRDGSPLQALVACPCLPVGMAFAAPDTS